MNDTVVLHGDERWKSPYVFSTFVALREKGLRFEFQTMSLHAGEHRPGTYPVLSMTGRVPGAPARRLLAGVLGNRRDLEDVFRRLAGLPSTLRAPGIGLARAAWLRTDLAAIRDERDVATVFGAPTTTSLTNAARDEVQRLVGVCARLLPTGERFLFGEFSIADADLALMLQRLLRNGDALPDRLQVYADGIWHRPSLREWVDHPRPVS